MKNPEERPKSLTETAFSMDTAIDYQVEEYEPLYKKLLKEYPPLKNSEGYWKTQNQKT